MIEVEDFDVLDHSGFDIVVSGKGITKITDPEISTCIREINKKNRIEKEKLFSMSQKITDNPSGFENFLDDIIGIKKKLENYFKRNVIIYKSPDIIFTQEIKDESSSNFDVININNMNKINFEDNTFFLILAIPYNYKEIKNIFLNLKKRYPNSAISIAYIENRDFVISTPHISHLGNPCHFCNIDNKISGLNNRVEDNWSKMLSFCQENDIDIPIKNIKLLDKAYISGAIIKKISSYNKNNQEMRHQDRCLPQVRLDLNTGRYEEEIIPHWPACDCIGI